MTTKQKVFLVGILLVAIFFRFYQIKTMPGGLFPDEAANGLDINLMQQGHLQPFYERGNGREALFFYMLWGSVEVFGKGPWQHHIISALVGVLAVLGCFLVTRKLFSLFDENKERATNLALWAAFFMAASTWHTVLSRTAFRANLIPLFTSFAVYFYLMAFKAETQAKKIWWAIAAGLTFGLGFYTYIAYRIMIPLVIIAILWPFAVDIFRKPRFQTFKQLWKPLIAAKIAEYIALIPLAYYFWTHPDSFIGRSGQVSVFNPELNGGNLIGAIIEVTKESLLAFFWQGDLNWRHNISGEPFLSIIISPFFAIGLVGVTFLAARYFFQPLKRKTDWKYFGLAGWFWAMLIPVITTAEGIPHGLRSIGMIPPVFMITAVGLFWVMGMVGKVVDRYWNFLRDWQRTILSYAFVAKTVVFIAAIILQTFFLYFVYAANSPENFYAFRSDLTVVSDYLKANGHKGTTYLVLDKFSVQTVDYFTTIDGANPSNPQNQPYTQVDPEDSWKLDGLKTGDEIVFCQSSLFDIKKFKEYHRRAYLVREDRNKFNQTVMAIYQVK